MDNYEILATELYKIASSYEKVEGNIFSEHLKFLKHNDLEIKRENIYNISKDVKSVFEIGFNAGHSALLFLLSNDNLKITCIDLGEHKYVIPCFEFLNKKFPNRIELHICNSLELKNQEFFMKNTYDLYHIDGGHTYDICLNDINTCYDNCKNNSYLILDDTNLSEIERILFIFKEKNKFLEKKMNYNFVHYKHTIGLFKKE